MQVMAALRGRGPTGVNTAKLKILRTAILPMIENIMTNHLGYLHAPIEHEG
jgi:hypothetical protein